MRVLEALFHCGKELAGECDGEHLVADEVDEGQHALVEICRADGVDSAGGKKHIETREDKALEIDGRGSAGNLAEQRDDAFPHCCVCGGLRFAEGGEDAWGDDVDVGCDELGAVLGGIDDESACCCSEEHALAFEMAPCDREAHVADHGHDFGALGVVHHGEREAERAQRGAAFALAGLAVLDHALDGSEPCGAGVREHCTELFVGWECGLEPVHRCRADLTDGIECKHEPCWNNLLEKGRDLTAHVACNVAHRGRDGFSDPLFAVVCDCDKEIGPVRESWCNLARLAACFGWRAAQRRQLAQRLDACDCVLFGQLAQHTGDIGIERVEL
eukprot:comp22036_c0_seq1/m.50801 comp22036_c0_seq1/g.50801  ORF comp22036_c0_seq1/g.50801 comp22036_c0_seq1/m.50801 type:complete len:330 (-) comp22036_c0_seq1:185-1174(-)